MADVFISYFKPERELTLALANDLEAAGYTVWWDTNLLPDDRFRSVIDEEIEACTRAIIIWTPGSIRRDWVLSEATHAHRLGRLLNTYAGGLDPNDIPKPFDQVNAASLDDRKKILASLARATPPKKQVPRLSLVPSTQVYPVDEAELIVETARRLEAETQREDWEKDPDDYAIHLMTAAEEVLEAIEKFEEAVQFADLPEFAQRVWLRRLQKAIEERRKTLKKELNWLGAHVTHGVISGARGDLHYAAENLIEACTHK